MKKKLRRLFYLVLFATLVFLFDQGTKSAVAGQVNISGHGVIHLTSFLNLVVVENYGISFGAFNDPAYSQLFFIILSSLISLVFAIWCIKSGDRNLIVPCGLIIGGALGNMYDRIQHGKVTDFLDFHYGIMHFPTFNIADAMIFIGVALILLLPTENTKEQI